MKDSTMMLLGGGALVVGVGGYLLLRKKPVPYTLNYTPPTTVLKSTEDAGARAAAAVRSMFGAKAASGASAGNGSVQAAAASQPNSAQKLVGGISNAFIPGSGAAATAISGPVISGLKSLFSW